MTIGERIKAYREKKGISQVELATAVNITKQSLYKYENNIVTNIPSDKIEAISSYLSVSPAYLMGWEEMSDRFTSKYPQPNVVQDVVTFPVIGEIAAGYDTAAIEDWSGDTVDIPVSFLHGRKKEEFFVLSVHGNSMYPMYLEGDKVLILKQSTLNRSGDVGAILYESDYATLKRVEYVMGEDWLQLIPVNPEYAPKRIEGADLEKCRVLGIPKLVIREMK